MPDNDEPARPFALNGIASVQSRETLGGLWSSEVTMKMRLGYDPADPAEVSMRVDTQTWVFDRALLEHALEKPSILQGDGDVTTQIGVSGMFRINLHSGDFEALIQIPLATVRMFVSMMEAAIPSDSVEYDVDSWLQEMDQA